MTHLPVMLDEVVSLFGPSRGQSRTIVDGTVGGGGHAEALLRFDGSLNLIGLDRDEDAVDRAGARLGIFGDRAAVYQGSFAETGEVLAEVGLDGVDGVLLDLGVSSYHLEDPERGFSFQFKGPLDMRLDRGRSLTAARIVARYSERDLADLIFKFGEERRSRAVARAIVSARQRGPIETTDRLAEVIVSALGGRRPGVKSVHPATRTFMALRMAVNDELGHLERFLKGVPDWLLKGGRLVVISFHSLEDRPVKEALVVYERGCVCPPRSPVCACGRKPSMRRLTRKPLRPSEGEVERNPRARSAKLRAAERL